MDPHRSGYYYLDVSLQFDDASVKVTKEVFKNCVLNGLENIFGEYGTCVPIDLVEFEEFRAGGIFQCPATFYAKFRAALTLTGEFEERICCLNTMSYCRKEGKDTIIFATKEDHQIPSTVTIPEPEKQPGVILADGSINWNCPCLGGMATGPCGIEFRDAFSCFHYSTADPKGSDCLPAFSRMQECMKSYPTLYAARTDDLDENFDLEDDDKLDEVDTKIEEKLENTPPSSQIEKK